MKYGTKRLVLPILLFGFATFFLAFKTFAQTPTPSNYDVTVSPVYLDLSANPGEKINTKIRIRNNTNSPLPIKLEVKKMAGDQVGNLTLQDTSNDNSLSWITFESDKLIANPLEWTDIPLTIDVPKEAAYGYYFAISLTQDGSSPIKTTGTSITGAAAIPVLLNVIKEGAKVQGKLVSLTTDSSWYEYPPIKFLTIFENTGNIHIRPTGNIFIKDILGRQVAALSVNSSQGTILPNAKRTFESIWNDSFIVREPKLEGGQPKLDRSGKPQTQLKIAWEKILNLRIGPYTATEIMILTVDNKDIPFETRTSFFVFPWKLVIGFLLFVIFAGIGFYSTLKNFVKRILKLFGVGKERQKKNEE